MEKFVKKYNQEMHDLAKQTYSLTFPIKPKPCPEVKPTGFSEDALLFVDQCQFVNEHKERCTNEARLYPHLCDEHGPLVYEMKIMPSTIPNAGYGLFTQIDLAEGDFIALYNGEALTSEQKKKRYPRADLTSYCYTVKKNDKGQEYDVVVDAASTQSCLARYINDGRDDPKYPTNAKYTPLSTAKGFIVPAALATKSIKAGEEIFISYGVSYWANKERKEKMQFSI